MTKDQINKLQEVFPKFNKVAASLAGRSNETGVVLSKKAMKIIAESVSDINPISNTISNIETNTDRFNRGKRRKPNRLVVYLDDDTFIRFNSYKTSMNMTTQDYLMMLIKEELK